MRVTLPRVIHAEWTKIRALRSTWTVLGAISVLVVAFGGVVAWNQNRDVDNPPTTADAVGGALLGIDLVALVIGVFGVLLMSGEYGSGLIRATLAAVPRRLPVLWAKAVVLTAVTAPVMLATCLAALAVSRAFLGADGPSLTDAAVLRAAAGAAGAAVATGLLGLAVGTLLRHTAGAITTLAAATLVIPALLPVALTDSVEDRVVPYIPTAAAQAMYALGDNNPFKMLSPGSGALVLAAWVVALLAGGSAVLHRRDA